MFKKLDFSSKILERSMHSGVMETRAMLGEYVQARVGEVGRQRAVDSLARELGWTTRRVLALLHGEVRRMWFDEVMAARAWHQDWSERESRRLDAKAALMRTRRETRQMGINGGSGEGGAGQVREMADGRLEREGGPGGRDVRDVAGPVRAAPEQAAHAVAAGGRGGR